MSPLRFPVNAATILERAYNGDANTSEIDKWLVYALGVPNSAAKDLCHKAMTSYNAQALGEPESEWEELGFLKPASPIDISSTSLHSILNHHLHMVQRQFPDAEPDPMDGQQFYVFSFVVLTRPDWRETGVTAVHCDKDRGKWKVTQCSGIPVDQLGMELTSVSDTDDQFDNVRGRYDASNNDHEDNLGGPAPKGEWQFIVYCTGISQLEAEHLIPDPRGGPDFGLGEACLWFLKWDLPVEGIQEAFPVAYAEAIRDPTVPATGGDRICKLHPSLFAIVDGRDLQSVNIVKVDWDRDFTRSEADLRRVGRESGTTVQSCEPSSIAPTLEKLANDDRNDS